MVEADPLLHIRRLTRRSSVPGPHETVLRSDLRRLLDDRKVLLDALSWYADTLAYFVTQQSEPRSSVHGDHGRRARTAIATVSLPTDQGGTDGGF